jgi:ribosome maturation factor RimP
MRQYKKNLGRKVTVTDNEGVEKTGLLKEVTDEHVVLEIKQPKNKGVVVTEIPFANIKKTVVQIIF